LIESCDGRYFSYFTNLTYIGLCAYFFASGVQTAAYASEKGRGYPLQRWPRVLQVLHVLLHSTIITYRASAFIAEKKQKKGGEDY